MDQVDRLSINGLPLESKTPAQAREELLGEIRIAAAIRVSLYVSRCLLQLHFPPLPHPHLPFPSPWHRPPERQKAFSEVIRPLVLCARRREACRPAALETQSGFLAGSAAQAKGLLVVIIVICHS